MASAGISSPQLQWQELPDDTRERDIDETEKFYKLFTRKGKGCFPVTGCASFILAESHGTLDEDVDRQIIAALRKAWTTLRLEQPTLGSHIERDRKSNQLKRVCRPLKNHHAAECWLDSTFKVIDTSEDAVHWFNNDAPAFDAPTVYLIRSNVDRAVCHTVFLRCPHDVTDGVGVLLLLNQLFNHAARAYTQREKYVLPDWSKKQLPPSPCLRVAAGMPPTLSDTQSKRWQEIQTQNGAVYKHPHLLTLPSSGTIPRSAESKIQRVSLSLSQTMSKQILRAGKAIAPGLSVTHVFMSALALALAELQPQKSESYPLRYVNHSMINLRPYCESPYNSTDHAAAPYHTISAQALGIDLVVPGSSTDAKTTSKLNDLSATAIRVRDFYKTVRPVVGAELHEQVYLAPLVFKCMTPGAGTDPHAVSDPPFCPVALSSIGNVGSMVAARHGPFDLTNAWASSEPIGAGVALFLGGWDGKIDLSAVFDNRYHDAGYIGRFLERILSCVRHGLGIDEGQTAVQPAARKITESKKRKLDDEETQGQRSIASSPLRERPLLGNVQALSPVSSKKAQENRWEGQEKKKIKSKA